MGSRVFFEGQYICAEMPALIMFTDEFEPMWRMIGADVTGNIVCIRAPKNGVAFIRTGHGWGRRATAEYYFVDFRARRVVKLRRRPVKKLYGRGYMDCVRVNEELYCFDWVDGRLRSVKNSLSSI